jgi:hypothetical protein
MLTKKEKKEYVFKKLDEILKPQGYKGFKTGGDPCYIINKENYRCKFYLNFSDMGDLYFSKYSMSIKQVESIVEEISSPNDTSHLDKERYISPTILDTSKNSYLYKIIETQKELEDFTNWVIDYLEKEGKHFIETYSYLPNILKKMDELLAEGKYWSEILSGCEDNLFRGLIISKLCNDKNYNKKIEYIDSIFYESPDDWLPYYEKLKERLKSVEPIYNV